MARETPADLRTPAESVPLDWGAARVHLAAHGLRLDADPPPRQFAGGLANLNYLIHLDGHPAVLRRPPLAKPGSAGIVRGRPMVYSIARMVAAKSSASEALAVSQVTTMTCSLWAPTTAWAF